MYINTTAKKILSSSDMQTVPQCDCVISILNLLYATEHKSGILLVRCAAVKVDYMVGDALAMPKSSVCLRNA